MFQHGADLNAVVSDPSEEVKLLSEKGHQRSRLEDFYFHDLCHTFCSNLLLSGSDLKDVKEMIGHSDIAMTDRYSHLPDQHKAFRQRRLAEYYAGGVGVGNT